MFPHGNFGEGDVVLFAHYDAGGRLGIGLERHAVTKNCPLLSTRKEPTPLSGSFPFVPPERYAPPN